MRTLIAIVFSISLSTFAAAPPRGADQLRNLAVFPEMSLNFNMGMRTEENHWVITDNSDASFEISQLARKLKSDPDNIETLLRLGYLLNEDNDTNGSEACREKVEKLCREQMAANPEDAVALDNLGDALSGLGRDDEAEAEYRKATLIAPNDWRCWVNLGNSLPSHRFLSMFPQNLHVQLTVGQPPPQAVLDYRPSPASLQIAENALTESSQCFDKALAIAPQEPEVYLQRAGYMIVSNWENLFFSYYSGKEKLDPSKWAMPQCSADAIANLKKAAELSPKNADYTGMAAFLEWMAAFTRAKSMNLTQDTLPEKTRQSIDNAMARLENLSQNPDERIAAGALEYLGMLNYVSGNSREAAVFLRRAVALDPTREQSWDILLGTTKTDADFPDEAVAICESRLKHNNSARNHLLLAKAYTHKNEWRDAAGEAEIAANLDTNNVIAPLMLAAIDLKLSANPEFMLKAKEQLDRASVLVRKGSGDESSQRWREMALNAAILFGLEATPDSEKLARQWLSLVLKHYPGDETASEILEALPGESPSTEAQDN